MSVGEYAGIPLQDNGNTERNGAIFLLERPTVLHRRDMETATVTLDGWTTTVKRSVNAVVTHGGSTSTRFEGTFAEALVAANQALDYFCVTGLADCRIRDVPNDCIVWWPDRARRGIMLRWSMIQNYEEVIDLGLKLTVTVHDAEGNVVPPPPPQTPTVREAYRYIRMCRTSDDLYDSYRNLFLAFECLLSEIRPQRQITSRRGWGCLRWGNPRTTWEGERKWFGDALDEAGRLVDLEHLTPPGVTNHSRWLLEKMYGKERSALMHAKSNRGRLLLPQDLPPRAELTASLERLWSYVMNLVRERFGVTRGVTDISAYAYGLLAKPMMQNLSVVVSDDDSPMAKTYADIFLPDGSTFIELQPSAPAVDADEPRLWTVVAHCKPSDLSGLTAIRKLGVKQRNDDSPPWVASELVGPLHLGAAVVGVDVVHGIRYVNPLIAPSQFSS